MTLDFEKQESKIGLFGHRYPFRNTVPVLDVFQLPKTIEQKHIPPCFHLLRSAPSWSEPNTVRFAERTQGNENVEEEPSE